jgi:hypothetical protein
MSDAGIKINGSSPPQVHASVVAGELESAWGCGLDSNTINRKERVRLPPASALGFTRLPLMIGPGREEEGGKGRRTE